ncbi:hypothetical protein C8D87_1011295 [Lentzea atacamensis]|uniref:Uncharacterized protein n=1 Tax=Lentzea atacamensis TaxID=531938 RepID=A0ABX9EIH8_9PSEU|nr:hypothetical protein [Lentzea atacamensis]RAS70994.1 hypothetical protein C8D87_1011295 [Lentzea atacamensis]
MRQPLEESLISEKANFRMRAALHAIRPGEAPLPASLATTVAHGWTEHESGAYLLREMADHSTGPKSDLHAYEAQSNSQDIPRGDDLAELLGVSLAYARACLRQAQKPVTALFSISEPYDDVIPVTTTVTFWADRGTRPEGFEHDLKPLMLLSTAKTDFLYACTEDHEKVMADTAEALTAQGLSREESVKRSA